MRQAGFRSCTWQITTHGLIHYFWMLIGQCQLLQCWLIDFSSGLSWFIIRVFLTDWFLIRIYKYICLYCPHLIATTSKNLAYSFAALYIENVLHNYESPKMLALWLWWAYLWSPHPLPDWCHASNIGINMLSDSFHKTKTVQYKINI